MLGWICPKCNNSVSPLVAICPCGVAASPLPRIDTTFEDQLCMHKSCTTCRGSGMRLDGLGACVHMISCPCKRCTPSYVVTSCTLNSNDPGFDIAKVEMKFTSAERLLA